MRLLPIRLPNNVRPLLQVCVFGIPAAGAWIDRQERLRVMRITFIVNNLCVVGSAVLAAGPCAAAVEVALVEPRA